MQNWMVTDFIIVLSYGLQHSLLTTKTAVAVYNKILPAYTWNICYSSISVVILVVGFNYWEKSGLVIFALTPGSLGYHIMTISLALSLFLFFYCFKYTTSFFQWLGIQQVIYKLKKEKEPQYYRLRKEGVKKYIRFPHHTCLIFFFWLHPVMTMDTLFLSICATIYLYIGTAHQDMRGLRLLGEEWGEYRKNTNLLLPSPKTIMRMIKNN